MITLKCRDCGIEFESKRKDTQRCRNCHKKNRSKQVMISRKKKFPEIEVGVGSGNHSRNKGKTHYSWKTGITGYRNLITKEECIWCSSTDHLLIHHKDENRYNNELDNLIVLCKQCHQKYHTKRDPKTGKYLAK